MVDDELLAKHFAGETLAEEEAAIQHWLGDPDHVAHYDDLREVWQLAPKARPQLPVDTDAAWLKVKQRLQADQKPAGAKVVPLVPTRKVATPEPPVEVPVQSAPETAPPADAPAGPQVRALRSTARPNWWRAAAAIALLVVAGAFWYRYWAQPQESFQQYAFQASEQPNTLQLADSSRVSLNRGTQLKFRSGTRLREATLQGEAYFAVKSDRARPFVVLAQGTEVRVTGTAFNVKAYSRDSVSVVVDEGRVVFSAGADSLPLVAGERAVYLHSTNKLYKYFNLDKNTAAYANRVFHFDQTPLGEVVYKLNEVYRTNIALATPALQGCLLTVDFENKDLEVVLQIIADTLGLTVEQLADGEIVLSGAGCN
jgi:ferric-dicitrate binding protein FerR (iron transport regulator)